MTDDDIITQRSPCSIAPPQSQDRQADPASGTFPRCVLSPNYLRQLCDTFEYAQTTEAWRDFLASEEDPVSATELDEQKKYFDVLQRTARLLIPIAQLWHIDGQPIDEVLTTNREDNIPQFDPNARKDFVLTLRNRVTIWENEIRLGLVQPPFSFEHAKRELTQSDVAIGILRSTKTLLDCVDEPFEPSSDPKELSIAIYDLFQWFRCYRQTNPRIGQFEAGDGRAVLSSVGELLNELHPLICRYRAFNFFAALDTYAVIYSDPAAKVITEKRESILTTLNRLTAGDPIPSELLTDQKAGSNTAVVEPVAESPAIKSRDPYENWMTLTEISKALDIPPYKLTRACDDKTIGSVGNYRQRRIDPISAIRYKLQMVTATR